MAEIRAEGTLDVDGLKVTVEKIGWRIRDSYHERMAGVSQTVATAANEWRMNSTARQALRTFHYIAQVADGIDLYENSWS